MKHASRITVALLCGAALVGSASLTPASARSKSATKAATKATAKSPTKDIVDTAVAGGSFKTLATALGAAGLVDTLKGKGPFTVFAPTDAAFAKIPKTDLDALLADKQKLTSVLTYHVIAGRVPAATVLTLNGKSATTVNGAPIAITVSGGKVVLNGNVNVTAVDIMATNGVIHVIDSVLLPPAAPAPTTTVAAPAAKDIVDTAVAAGSFKTLATALGAAGLVETLKGKGPFTVFAPTDAAFAKIPKADLDALLADKKALTDVLTYHLIRGKVPASTVVTFNGQRVKTVNGADVSVKVVAGKVVLNDTVNVTTTDIEASNGIIHVIDSVLLPPKPTATAAPVVAGSIVDVAARNGSFKTLLAAVDAAGLTATLQGPGPFTLFAPTDAAFNLLPPGTVQNLLLPESKATLTKILTLHVVAGQALAADIIKDHATITSLNGQKLPVSVRNGRVFIGSAVVQIADVKATNGVIHVIDTVLLPG
jgi:transforming growth factor-beta-induced protein